MAKSVSGDKMKYCGLCVALLLLCAVPVASWGQVLSDPTRPPSGIGDPVVSPGLTVNLQVKGLQSVILSPNRCAAIIDGKTVELGAKHGDERLIEVTERGVVLQGAHGRHEMALFPAVGIKMTEDSGKQAIKCNPDQNEQAIHPPKQAGQKEKK